MTERDDELSRAPGWLRSAVEQLRRPEPRSPGAVDAVVSRALASSLAGDDSPGHARKSHGRHSVWAWFLRPSMALSPLAAAATVLLLVLSTLALARLWSGGAGGTDLASTQTVRHQFVLVAPQASSVSLVGDFNGWQLGATELERQGSVWTVELPLPPGRHVYAFVINGQEWVADASAARAPEDEFGRPNSVILVPERGI